jgi:signal transduction histidine kinase
MNFHSLRVRMLVAALVPVALVVVALVSVFWLNRLADLEETHSQRGKSLLQQVVTTSEYGLFSGNLESLQSVVNAMQTDVDVRSAAVFDSRGVLLVSIGFPVYKTLTELSDSKYASRQRERGIDTLFATISSSKVPLDDLFAAQGETRPAQALVLGHAVVEVSRDSLSAREREMLFLSVGVGLVGLLLGGLLATRMGEGVLQPILHISRRIEGIGQGDFSGDTSIKPDDPLHGLQMKLDQMASRLQWGRDELEQRVATVTHELRLKKEEAETATLAKSRFLAAASHDLRQPTHALGLFIARLGQLSLDGQASLLVGNLERSVQAMQDLLDGLLDLSRLESGAVKVHMQAVRVQNLLDAIRSALEPAAAEKGLHLRIRPSTLWAVTDSVQLQRMVMNLTHNAIRYTDHGTVLLACRSAGDGKHLRIEVWDSGIGISSEHQTDIFKEFYQVGNPGRERTRGLGLGLNIVERSAQLLGHQVTVRSALGHGTRFSITVPIAEPVNSELTVIEPVIAVVGGLDGLRVLVLEDDALALEAMVGLLGSWGCNVLAAQTVVQARKFMQPECLPDVLVSDYRLGDGDNGLSAISALRVLAGKEIPACLMSGDTDGELMQAARDAGLTLLHKPVRPAKLRALLRRLVATV